MARGATNCRTHRWWVSSNRHSGARVSANPESRDSGFDAEPVIGPRFARTRWHRPGMTVIVLTPRRFRFPDRLPDLHRRQRGVQRLDAEFAERIHHPTGASGTP